MNRTISDVRPHDLLVELFIATREEKGCSALTIRNYRNCLNRFTAFAIPDDISELKPDHVILWLASLRHKGMSAANRAYHQRHVFAWLRWLYGREDIQRDPLRGVSAVQVPQVLHYQVSNDDYVKLEAVALDRSAFLSKRDVAVLRMLWATGLRRAELCSLDLKDLDMQTLTLIVTGKGNKQRRVPFDTRTKVALLEYFTRERGREDGPLFVSRDGERLTGDAMRLLLARVAKRAGVPASAHAFRRGFARRMRASGLDLGETAALLGHETLVMTRHYSQVGEQDAAIDAYRRAVG